MKNWHTTVIKLDKANTILTQNGLDEFGNPNIYVGVMEGSIEYVPIDNTQPINESNNYKVPNIHLNNEPDEAIDKKVVFRKIIDENFYDENLNDEAYKNPLTHTTSVAGIIAGKKTNNNNVSGICPNVKIINALSKFENALILSEINQYSKANIKSFHYDNEIIKNNNGSLITGSNYFDYSENIVPNEAINESNIYSSIINCSYSWSNTPIVDGQDLNGNKIKVPKYMPAKITDFVMKELFAYGRDGRGVLTVFAAGNENQNVTYSSSPHTLSNKTLVVAASKVTLDENKLNLYTSITNPIDFDEDKANYSNFGERIDLCAPSCPVGKSAKDEIEIYAPTMINSGEIGESDQIFTSAVLKRKSSNKLILTHNHGGIFPGQSIEIGDPTTFYHEVRFITDVNIVQEPADIDPKKNLRTQITLDQNVFFTDEHSSTNYTIEGSIIKICIFKKTATVTSSNRLKINNMNGIGESQLIPQKAYIYSGDDQLTGRPVEITSTFFTRKEIETNFRLPFNTGTIVTLIPGQFFTKLKRTDSTSSLFQASDSSSMQGLFAGQQVFIKEEELKRHIEYINSRGQLKFSQLSASTDENVTNFSEYNIKSLAYGNLTNSFGGTSAAAPIVSGVSALLLSVNPNLNAAEIKHILKSTADKIKLKENSSNGRWKDKNGTNISFSNASTLQSNTTIGSNEITVNDSSVYQVNDSIEIDGDFRSVIEKIAGNHLLLQLAVTKVYNAGENVKKGTSPFHSGYFGAGRVNAERAVQLALDWHSLSPTQTVEKPRLEIFDTTERDINDKAIIVDVNTSVDSPDIWIKPLSVTDDILPTETQRFNTIKTEAPQQIYVRVTNKGNRDSFKECDLRVLVAFTDNECDPFAFPSSWYDQTNVKLLSVKEIPIIVPGGEAIIKIEWKDIAQKWDAVNSWNPIDPATGRRKKTYILAHIAPFDGLAEEVDLTNIRNNKQLTCKEIIVEHNGVKDGTAFIPSDKLDITVGSTLVTKDCEFVMENILTADLDNIRVKATKTNNDSTKTTEDVSFIKTDGVWTIDDDTINWITFHPPIETEGDETDRTNIRFPHTLKVKNTELEVKLEIVNI